LEEFAACWEGLEDPRTGNADDAGQFRIGEGNRHHVCAAIVNHKKPHKGDPVLFLDLDKVETVCKIDYDALIQHEEVGGYVIGSDINGRPIDPNHPWSG
jgi:hypothetical protein